MAPRAFAACGLSDLTRLAAAALAAATMALARIARPRGELINVSKASVSVFGIVTPITFVAARRLLACAGFLVAPLALAAARLPFTAVFAVPLFRGRGGAFAIGVTSLEFQLHPWLELP